MIRANALVLACLLGGATMIALSCASSSGGPLSGSQETSYFEGLNLPDNFHWSKDKNGPPDSWVVMGYERAPSNAAVLSFTAFRQDESHANKVSEDVTIVIGPKPSVPVKSWATSAEQAYDAQCPGGVTRTEIRTTTDEYLTNDVLASCGSYPQREFVIRYLNGDWTGFQITYGRSGRLLKPAEREQAIQLVSSFTITYCPAPSSNCPRLLYYGTPRPR
jgi:hypothetical protein